MRGNCFLQSLFSFSFPLALFGWSCELAKAKDLRCYNCAESKPTYVLPYSGCLNPDKRSEVTCSKEANACVKLHGFLHLDIGKLHMVARMCAKLEKRQRLACDSKPVAIISSETIDLSLANQLPPAAGTNSSLWLFHLRDVDICRCKTELCNKEPGLETTLGDLSGGTKVMAFSRCDVGLVMLALVVRCGGYRYRFIAAAALTSLSQTWLVDVLRKLCAVCKLLPFFRSNSTCLGHGESKTW